MNGDHLFSERFQEMLLLKDQVLGKEYEAEVVENIPELQDFLSLDNRILLFFKSAKQKNLSTGSTSSDKSPECVRKGHMDVSLGLDLTGSPLKCPFTPTKEDDTEDVTSATSNSSPVSLCPTRLPVSSIVATNFLGKCLGLKQIEEEELAVVAVCDGEDLMSTCLLGWCPEPQLNIRIIGNRIGSAMVQSDINKLPEWREINNGSKSSKKCFSRYVLSGGECSLAGSERMLEVECEWTVSEARLLDPPSNNATVTAHLKVAPDDLQSSIAHMYSELKILEGLAEGLTTGEVTWFCADREISTTDEVYTFLEDVRSVSTVSRRSSIRSSTVSRRSGVRTEDNTSAPKDAPEEGDHSLAGREQLDILDKLWNVLKYCRSMKELTESLTTVIGELRGTDIKHMMKAKKGTRLAGILDRSLPLPDLSGVVPLHLLVEVGVQKLREDYSYILLSNMFVHKADLKPFVELQSALEPEAVTALRKLHYCLDLVAVLLHEFEIPHMAMCYITRSIMEFYGNRDHIDDNHVFTFSLPKSAIQNVCDKMPPVVWSVTGSEGDQSYRTETRHVITLANTPLAETDLKNRLFDYTRVRTVYDSLVY